MSKLQSPTKRATKIDRLRKAAKFFWLLSAFITWSFFWSVAQEQEGHRMVLFITSVVLSAAFQYGITLAESALFDGSLPAPWNIEWKEGGPLPWLCIGAITALFVDITLNIGGVWVYVSKMEKSGIGAVGIDAAAIGVLKIVSTVAIAALCAVGSELLEEYANYLETGVATRPPQRQERQEREPQLEELRQREEPKSRSGASPEEIEALKKRRIEMQQHQRNRRGE